MGIVIDDDLDAKGVALEAYQQADNTKFAYEQSIKRFRRYGYEIPCCVVDVKRYLLQSIVDFEAEGRAVKVATLRLWVAAIGDAHMGIDNPVTTPDIKQLMQSIARKYGVTQEQAYALRQADVITLLREGIGYRFDALGRKIENDNPLKDARDTALLLIGWTGAFRVSELLALRVDDLEPVNDGMVITVRKSKTDQQGTGFKKYIPLAEGKICPVQALKAWLAASHIREGLVFRGIKRWRHGDEVVFVLGDTMMSPVSLGRILKRLAALAGLENVERISCHSLRAGFITEAARQGKPIWKIKTMSGHKSDTVLGRYIRDLGTWGEDNPSHGMW